MATVEGLCDNIAAGQLSVVTAVLQTSPSLACTAHPKTGWYPLHVAARHGHVSLIQLLCQQYSADPNAKGKGPGSPTALWVAAYGGQSIDVFRSLVSFGADINLPNSEKQTPLFAAAKNGLYETVCSLADLSADINRTDGWRTPLHVAIVEPRAPAAALRTVQVLVAKGAKVNALDGFGQTPLFVSCAEGKIEIVQWLLTQAASGSSSSNNSRSVVDVMVRSTGGPYPGLTAWDAALRRKDAVGEATVAVMRQCGCTTPPPLDPSARAPPQQCPVQ